jgi:hypothetical protein
MSTQLQTNNKTFLGRYWTEHSVLRRYVHSDRELRILSFGCSTGEELLGIRALFPGADLYGCDVDWQNLQKARALVGSAATIFESNPRQLAAHGPFDVILCNSVLLQPTRVDASGRKAGIPAALWIDALAQLDDVLLPGGFLQIINSNVPFRMHPLAAEYEPLRSPLILGPNFVDQFHIDGRHLCTGVGGGGWSALTHRHLGEDAWRELQPTDLHDVHFRKSGGTRPIATVDDEQIPSLAGGPCLASGTVEYRVSVDPHESRPSTHLDVAVRWTTSGVDAVRVERTARRIWFDGSVQWTAATSVDMTDTAAGAFLDSMLGRRSTRIAMDELLLPKPIRASAF